MLKNHIKIAWRNLTSNTLFSSINILGLSLGLAVTVLLYLFITHERSFDTMYSQKDQIYRVILDTKMSGDNEVYTTAPAALAPAIKTDAANVNTVARIYKHSFGEVASIEALNETYLEHNLFWADPSLLTIFDVEFVNGQASTSLIRPNTIIISQKAAATYFGSTDPIGKIIKLDNAKNLEVTGVYKDFPSNSTLDCNMIASFTGSNFDKNPSWGNVSFETFCVLNQGSTQASTEAQIRQILDKNVEKDDQWYSLSLQSLRDIHLYSASYQNSIHAHTGDIKEIRNLSLLAILILAIACVNYMNLITARSQKRAKDVGVNKTLGASKRNLLNRFYIETGVITLISLAVGLLIAILCLPLFNMLTGQNLALDLLFSAEFFVGLTIIWVVTTLISGSYPAFYLSGFSPKSILNPSFKRGKHISMVRKGLVVLQFAASIVLIVSVLVIYKQMNFIKTKKLGYEPEQVLAISTSGIPNDSKVEALMASYNTLTDVKSTAWVQGYPGMTVSGRSLFRDDQDEEGLNIQTNHAEGAIAETLQLKLLAGKMPAKRIEGDTLVEVVINKITLDYLGFTPEEALGKKVNMYLGNNASIVGVIDNFNFASLHEPIKAYAFHNNPSESKSYVLVRYNNSSTADIIAQLKNTFNTVEPTAIFDYTFLTDNVAKLYVKEEKTASVNVLFCGLAIFIACLGLFALAAFTTEQRTKEIGVRKVLGASTASITSMLSKDFVKLILIAIVIAFPLAYWFMNDWLTGFAYRINIGWTTYFIAGISALIIALITISYQSLKAALMDPAKSLRSD